MFFQVAGPLLAKAARALQTDTLLADDEFAARQRRRVSRLLRRLGECWPGTFAVLQQQSAIHRLAASAARTALESHGRDVPPRDPGAEDHDPLADHLAQLAELDRLVSALHDAGSDGWARSARRHLRHQLAEAARVESELLEPPVPS